MSEDVPRFEAGRSVHAGITPAEARELQKLYDLLPNASLAAAEALRTAGDAPTRAAFQRFKELDAYVDTIIDRIREIIG